MREQETSDKTNLRAETLDEGEVDLEGDSETDREVDRDPEAKSDGGRVTDDVGGGEWEGDGDNEAVTEGVPLGGWLAEPE